MYKQTEGFTLEEITMKHTEGLEKPTSGKPPLSDKEAKAAAVDSYARSLLLASYREKAKAEGRPTQVGCTDNGAVLKTWRNANCPKCHSKESLFCRFIIAEPNGNSHECIDTKCYLCSYLFGACELKAGQWEVYIQNWEG